VTLHVALVTDAAYLPWCATAVRSVADHHGPGEAIVHVVHDGTVAGADERRLLESAGPLELRVHRPGRAFVEHLPAVDRFGRVVWLRFLLPELLGEVDRALYLDADTLVVAPLEELQRLDLRGSPVGAVRNVMVPHEEERVRRLGLDPARFFNSGVLLLDLAALREEGLAACAADVATALAGRLRWPDQDVLNVLFADRWAPLHPRFNAQNSLFEWPEASSAAHGREVRADAVARPAVLHFEGPHLCKPWHALSEHAWRDRYLATLARTPWAGVPLEDDGPTTRAIRRLPARWRLPVYEQVVRARSGARPSVRGALRRRRHGSRLG
jgi:lipopolysaccharide biosynthesis glycosyltransferase